MLNGINKLLTGDILKAISDMGHGDVLMIVDGNFPGEKLAKTTTFGKLIRVPDANSTDMYAAIAPFFPLDVDYSENSCCVLELTASDVKRGFTTPAAWTDYASILHERYPNEELGHVERFAFYEKAKNAYAIIQTGEERQYGCIMLVKGCVI